MGSFDDRDVIITGGTGVLGSAVVAQVLDGGGRAHVPVFDSNELQRFAHRDHQRLRVYEGVDLGDEQAVASLYEKVPGLYASVHIAGGFAMGPIEDTSLATWEHLMRMNATTCFLCCRQAVRTMASREGRLVNVAARPALVPTGQMAAYAASKAAVAALTQSLAEELASSSIWVNAVVPSIIDTPANRAAMPDADHRAWPTPEGIARTIAFLASPGNAVTRGALVPVYGRS
jgi:NAD(P)-dependent dehydrogenase (short-subunit alcohol dehydrogenase family)